MPHRKAKLRPRLPQAQRRKSMNLQSPYGDETSLTHKEGVRTAEHRPSFQVAVATMMHRPVSYGIKIEPATHGIAVHQTLRKAAILHSTLATVTAPHSAGTLQIRGGGTTGGIGVPGGVHGTATGIGRTTIP